VCSLVQRIEEFPKEIRTTLTDPKKLDMLDISIIRLDKASAASLFLSLDMRQHQWDSLAKALNSLLQKGEKYKGRVLPNTTTLTDWLEKQGARLRYDDVTLIDVDVRDRVGVIDLSRDADNSDMEEAGP
jgi:hypothetical protein